MVGFRIDVIPFDVPEPLRQEVVNCIKVIGTKIKEAELFVSLGK